MPISPEHAFKEKSTKLLILPSLRTIYNRTFQCETPCSRVFADIKYNIRFDITDLISNFGINIEAIPKSDIKYVIKSDIVFDIRTTWANC
jgi:hypothetical protein